MNPLRAGWLAAEWRAPSPAAGYAESLIDLSQLGPVEHLEAIGGKQAIMPTSSGHSSARGYADLHDHLALLEREGLLIRVARPINKDTELHPPVRWQFRGGIPEPERKAFLFEHVTDAKGRRYGMPVVVGALAANRRIYSLGIGYPVEAIGQKWRDAIAHPIPTVRVDRGPVHDVVRTGDQLDEPGGGLDLLPIPISTPGFDNAPYVSCAAWITKDPETGAQNVGCYRGQLKARRRLGMNPSVDLRPGIHLHWLKYRELGRPMPAALTHLRVI